MSTDIETEIQSKGLTAPRLTPNDIEANIASEHYFTAEQGLTGALLDEEGEVAHDAPDSLRLLTFCVLVTDTGAVFVGKYAFDTAEEFDAALGAQLARDNALQQLIDAGN